MMACLFHRRRVWSALAFAAALAWAERALADASVAATTQTSCAGTRFASDLNCTSNDFTTSATFTQPSATALAQCVAGETLSLDIIAAITSHAPDRYDGAIFVGESANDPQLNNSSGTCSIGVFPNTPAPFFEDTKSGTQSPDTCGDFTQNSTTNLTVTGVRVLCKAAPGTNVLGLPYALTFSQSQTATCTPSNATAETKAKCIAATSQQVTGVIVQGWVNVTKATNPTGQSQSFTFTASGGSTPSPTSFSLTDGQSRKVQIPLSSSGGTVSLQIDETAVAGWNSTSSISCTTPSGATASYVTVDTTNHRITATLDTTNYGANCTVTNEKLATITLKENSNGGTDSFSFNSGSNGLPSSLTLSTATFNPISSSAYPVTADGQQAQITQSIPSGWVLSSATCTDGSTTFGSLSGSTLTVPAANITAGKNITCTFTNDKLATITIKEQSNGGTTSFSFGSGSNGLPSSLSLNTATTNPISSSAYTVTSNGQQAQITQTIPAGWVLSSASCSDGSSTFGSLSSGTLTIPSGNITAGKDITCTFTNDKLATITIAEQSNGGTTSFSFGSGSNGLPSSLTLNTATSNPISSSAYTVTSNGQQAQITQTIPSGWVLSSATCSDGSSTFGSLSSAVLTIPSGNITAGKTITCTFTNDKLATVTIREQSNGGTTSFSFGSGTNGLPSSLSLNTATTNPISSSAYAVTSNGQSTAITQTVPTGWVLTSATCSDGSTTFGTLASSTLTINGTNVVAGAAITCTFTNTRNASLAKAFSPTSVPVGVSSTLTFTVTNSSGNPAQSPLSFRDTFATSLVVASPLTTTNTCGGTLYRGGTTTPLAAGDTSFELSGGSLSSGTGSCTITVKVSSSTVGSYTNGASQISGTVGISTSSMTDQTLTVYALPNLLMVKSADHSTAKPGDVVTYTLVVQNAGSGPATSVVLLDPISQYLAWSLDSYGSGVAFQFTDGSPATGLTLGTPQYFSDAAMTTSLTPSSGGGGASSGYDNRVRAWKIAMSGTMAAGTQFTLTFKVSIR